jgi:hypothetical protein
MISVVILLLEVAKYHQVQLLSVISLQEIPYSLENHVSSFDRRIPVYTRRDSGEDDSVEASLNSKLQGVLIARSLYPQHKNDNRKTQDIPIASAHHD